MISKVCLVLMVIVSSCKSQYHFNNVFVIDDGITVEKKDTLKIYDENYNKDNKVYKAGKSFIYSYYHQNVNGAKFLISKGQEIKKGNYGVFDWKFVEADKENQETVKYIILKPNLGNPFKNDLPDYNQTAIGIEYRMNNGQSFGMEITGAIENRINTWMHPPRSHLFKILELNPFPYIKAPLKIGTTWEWKLKIGDYWSDKRWMEWQGGIENVCKYEIVDKKMMDTKLGTIQCFVIKSIAKSRIGETKLLSYFNETYGFVKLDYTNIDGTNTVLALEKME